MSGTAPGVGSSKLSSMPSGVSSAVIEGTFLVGPLRREKELPSLANSLGLLHTPRHLPSSSLDKSKRKIVAPPACSAQEPSSDWCAVSARAGAGSSSKARSESQRASIAATLAEFAGAAKAKGGPEGAAPLVFVD